MKTTLNIMAWTYGILVSFILLGLIVNYSSPSKPLDPRDSARYACQTFIQKNANDPTSIVFLTDRPQVVTHIGENVWTAAMTFRGKNGFGATTLSSAGCLMYLVKDEWTLVELKQE